MSPPQVKILFQAILKTLNEGGNTRIFFKNIMQIGYEEKYQLDNYQENSALSMITKLSWMQNSLGNIFWQNSNSLMEQDYIYNNLFFDFSYISQIITHEQLRFIVDIIVTQLMAAYRNILPIKNNILRTCIFIDEAQIFMPRSDNRNMTRLEEVLSTLRYKGVTVIATGVSADTMSSFLLDTNFIVQFRSDSKSLNANLGLEKNDTSLNQLKPYHAYVRTKGNNLRSVLIHLNKMNIEPNYMNYENRVNKQIIKIGIPLEQFEITSSIIWEIKLNMIFKKHINIHKKHLSFFLNEVSLFYDAYLIDYKIILNKNALFKFANYIIHNFHNLLKMNIIYERISNSSLDFLLLTFQSYLYKSLTTNNLDLNINNPDKFNLLISESIAFLKTKHQPNYEYVIDDVRVLYNRSVSNLLISVDEHNHLIQRIYGDIFTKIKNRLMLSNDKISDIEALELALDVNILNQTNYNLLFQMVEHSQSITTPLLWGIKEEIEQLPNTFDY